MERERTRSANSAEFQYASNQARVVTTSHGSPRSTARPGNPPAITNQQIAFPPEPETQPEQCPNLHQIRETKTPEGNAAPGEVAAAATMAVATATTAATRTVTIAIAAVGSKAAVEAEAVGEMGAAEEDPVRVPAARPSRLR